MTRELSQIQDDLASRTAKCQPATTILEGSKQDIFGNGSIHSILKEGVKGRLLIAVNAAPAPVKARFNVSGAKRAEVLFEKRILDVKNGFADEFESNGVHVYRLK